MTRAGLPPAGDTVTHVAPRRLRCDQLCAGIDGRPIVSALDLDVAPGAMVAVVGENGSGKSTVLRALAGLTAPLAGRVQIDGIDLRRLPRRERARTLAWVGQEDVPSEELLVWQAVALGLVPYQRPWAGEGRDERRAIAEALALVDMAGFADRRCDHLSGGERRRVMLARGLVQHTGLLIADEPTNHLDLAHQHDLLTVLRRTGRTVIASLHDLSLARTAFDAVVVLPRAGRRGTAPTVGPAADVLVPDVISAAFGVTATLLTDPDTGCDHLVIPGPDPSPTRKAQP